MAQCLVTLRLLSSDNSEALQLKPNSYLTECYHSWWEEEQKEENIPEIVKDASRFLQDLKLDYRLRAPLKKGLFVADIVTGRRGQNFALEPRPKPLHNLQRRILGEARWRFKMLDGMVSFTVHLMLCEIQLWKRRYFILM